MGPGHKTVHESWKSHEEPLRSVIEKYNQFLETSTVEHCREVVQLCFFAAQSPTVPSEIQSRCNTLLVKCLYDWLTSNETFNLLRPPSETRAYLHELLWNDQHAPRWQDAIIRYLLRCYDETGQLVYLDEVMDLLASSVVCTPPEDSRRPVLDLLDAESKSRRVPDLVLSHIDPVPASTIGATSDIHRGIFNGQIVAIKFPRFVYGNEKEHQEAREWFRRERHLWRRAQYKHILTLLGQCEHNGRIGVVSPWKANGNALEYVRDQPNANRMMILLQTALAVDYLHSHNPTFVHGDIKSVNVLIDDDGSALLSDFGVSRLIKNFDCTFNPRTATSKANMGTIRYMAPELFHTDEENLSEEEETNQGDSQSPLAGVRKWEKTTASDVYAFGCLILELLSGKCPFHTVKNDVDLMIKIMKGRKPKTPLDFDPSLTTLCDACWEKDPERRPSMGDVVKHFQSACGVTADAQDASEMITS